VEGKSKEPQDKSLVSGADRKIVEGEEDWLEVLVDDLFQIFPALTMKDFAQ